MCVPVVEEYAYIMFYMLKIRNECIPRQYTHSVFADILMHYFCDTNINKIKSTFIALRLSP